VIRDARRAADTRWTAAVAAFYNAEIEWAAGQPARALAAAEEALAGGIPHPQALVARGTCQWARFELDKRQPGPASHQPAVVPLLAAALIEDRAFAQLQAGDLEPAADTFGAAAVGWRGKIARNELRALWGQAEITRRRGETKKAAVALRELDSRCAALGDAAIVARVRASLSRIPSRPARAVAAGKLSAREREVLRLVRDGMTTPQIAATLCRATVARRARACPPPRRGEERHPSRRGNGCFASHRNASPEGHPPAAGTGEQRRSGRDRAVTINGTSSP
jgi:hypothetical protein